MLAKYKPLTYQVSHHASKEQPKEILLTESYRLEEQNWVNTTTKSSDQIHMAVHKNPTITKGFCIFKKLNYTVPLKELMILKL